MIGAAPLVIVAGLAKADSTHPFYGHEGDMVLPRPLPVGMAVGVHASPLSGSPRRVCACASLTTVQCRMA